MLIQAVLRPAVIPGVSGASVSDVCAGVCAAVRKETTFSASEPTVKGSFSVEEPRQLIQGQCYSVFYVFQLLSGLTKNTYISVETISELPDCPGCSSPVLASANVDSASEL